MSMFNILVLVTLGVGIVLVVIAIRMDRTSSFDNGSFMSEMVIGMFGGFLIAGAVLAKIIESFA